MVNFASSQVVLGSITQLHGWLLLHVSVSLWLLLEAVLVMDWQT